MERLLLEEGQGKKNKRYKKNEYRQAWQEDYILADGKHEAIIDEELWNKVREKRIETGIKQPSKVGKDRVHLLSGILRCPSCGGGNVYQ